MAIDLQAAAERYQRTIDGGKLYDVYEIEQWGHLFNLPSEARDEDRRQLANAYAAELDATLVDEAWLRETLGEPDDRGFGLDWNFGNYRIELTSGTIEVWMLLKTRVAINPTRGFVRTLQRIGGGT